MTPPLLVLFCCKIRPDAFNPYDILFSCIFTSAAKGYRIHLKLRNRLSNREHTTAAIILHNDYHTNIQQRRQVISKETSFHIVRVMFNEYIDLVIKLHFRIEYYKMDVGYSMRLLNDRG